MIREQLAWAMFKFLQARTNKPLRFGINKAYFWSGWIISEDDDDLYIELCEVNGYPDDIRAEPAIFEGEFAELESAFWEEFGHRVCRDLEQFETWLEDNDREQLPYFWSINMPKKYEAYWNAIEEAELDALECRQFRSNFFN